MRLRLLLSFFLLVLSGGVLFAQTKTDDYVAGVSDASYNFGSATVGAIGGIHEFFYNDYNGTGGGNATLTVSGPFRFSSFTGVDEGKTAMGGDEFGSAYVEFVPTGPGLQSGGLTITLSNGASRTIPLTGTGIPVATLTASPSGVDFGSNLTGTEAFKFFTLTGTNVTSDTRITVDSGPFGAGGTIDPNQLLNGGQAQVGVSFFAGTPGVYSGSLTLTTTGGTDLRQISITVPLTGVSIPQPTTPAPENAIGGIEAALQAIVAEPIQLGTGSYEYSHTDLKLNAITGAVDFARFYNSINKAVDSPVGFGWSHSFNYKVTVKKDAASGQDLQWDLRYPDGHLASFVPKGAGSYPLYIGTTDSLQKNSGGDFTLFTKDNHRYHFTSAGVLDQVTDLNGNVTALTYANNNLITVSAPGGRKYILTYSGTRVSSITDPLNRTCNYTYDTNGNLLSAKDANGGITNFTYDASHNMLTVVNALGNTLVSNTYNSDGKVSQQQDAYSQTTSIAYNTPYTGDATVTNPDASQMVAHHDASYRKTSIRDELGFTKYYNYDANSNENSFTDENNVPETRQFDKMGNLLSKTRNSNTATFTYNSFNSPLTATDPNGNVTNFTYDAADNLISAKRADNTTQSFTYNTSGQRTAYKDGRGNTTTYTYSPAGDLISVAAPNGIKTFQYDLAGRVVVAIDENGNTTKTAYDNNDNILSTTDALNHNTTFTYNANNKLLTVTDKLGLTTAFTYDKKDRLSTKTDANGGITRYAYDSRDNLVSATDANGNPVSYAYDKKNRKASATNGLGTTQYQYDAVGNLLSLVNAASQTTSYTYTATNKIKTQRDALSNTVTYNYDKNDNVISVTDPMFRSTGYTYDALNRLVTVLDAASNTTRITYDENGNKKTVADPKGHVQTNTFDAANRLTSTLDAAGNTTSYVYDAAGNINTISNPTGTISKVYDALNRVTAITNSTGDNYGFTYDNNNNITSMAGTAGKTLMVYDKLNRLTQYTDPYNNKVLYAYDAVGNKTSVTYPGNKMVAYTYDKVNDLATVADWMSHTFTYSYDAVGRNTKLLYPNGMHSDMTYDAGGRLLSKKNMSAANAVLTGSTFTLDAIGNRLTEQKQGAIPSNLKPSAKSYTYGNDDRMQKDSIWTYVNDNAGNRTSESNGKVQAAYTFSDDGRLTRMTDTLGVTSAFVYDPLGNRLARTVGSTSNHYVVDVAGGLSQVLQITDASGAIRSQYVSGLGLLERVDSLSNASYYLYDGAHNTAALTDVTGAVTDTYTYDPFGALLVHKGNINQPFTFLGEYGAERETNTIYYARARYYDAAAGRFLSKDTYPYSLDNPQTINRYAYATNNPLLRYDPTGLLGNEDWASDAKAFWSDLEGLSGDVDIADFLFDITDNTNKAWNYVTDFLKSTDISTTASDIGELRFGSALKAGGDILSGTGAILENANLYHEFYNHEVYGDDIRPSTFVNALAGPALILAGAGATAIGAPVVIIGVAVIGLGYGAASLIGGEDFDNAIDKGVNSLYENHIRRWYDRNIRY